MTSIQSQKPTAIAPGNMQEQASTESCYQRNKNLINVLGFTISLIAIILTEIAYGKPLYDAPEFDTISSFNGNMPSWMLTAFSFFSETGGGKTIGPSLVLLTLWMGERKRFVYYTFLLSVTVFVILIGKMLYKQDRPVWVNSDLTYKNDINCAAEYGNPSGHSMLGSVLAFTILFDVLQANRTRANGRVNIGLAVLFTVLALLYSVLMALTRVVIATHAWNQIIYGWLLGVWIAFFCQIVVREKLNVFVEAHLLGISIQTGKKIGITIGLMTVFTLLQFAAYYVSTLYSNKSDEEIAQVILNAKSICEDFNGEDAFNAKSFKDIGLTPVFFGAMIGVFLQAKYFEGQSAMKMPEKYQVLKWFGRFLVLVVLSLPWVALMALPLKQMWLRMLKYFIPIFGWNITLAFVLDTVCLKLKLYDPK